MTIQPDRRVFVRMAAAAAGAIVTGVALTAVAPAAFAQSPAGKPLRVILPLGAGSGVDGIIRAVAPLLSKALDGQPVVIENQPGAGSLTGTLAIAKAPPDGLTVGVVSNNFAVNPSVYRKMPYDTLNDLLPIAVVGATPLLLLVNPAKVPAKTAQELAAFLRAKPGEYNYASSGNGTVIHLAGEMFVDAAGAEVRHIPYKSTGAMVADLIGGQVELGVVALPAVRGLIQAGQLRAIGVMGKSRIKSLPDLPTIAEQGFPEIDVAGWFAFMAPARLPASQVAHLHEAIVAAFNTPEAKEAMLKQETTVAPMNPEESATFIKAEVARYARLVKKAGVSLD